MLRIRRRVYVPRVNGPHGKRNKTKVEKEAGVEGEDKDAEDGAGEISEIGEAVRLDV